MGFIRNNKYICYGRIRIKMMTKTAYHISNANEIFAKQNIYIITNIVRCDFVIKGKWDGFVSGRLEVIFYNADKSVNAMIPGLTWESWYATNVNGFLNGKSFNQAMLIKILQRDLYI